MKLIRTENPERFVTVFTFAADAAELEAACQAVYERSRSNIQIEGYAQGEADRAAIEAANGETFFWYEAINDCMEREVPALLEAALAENGLEPVDEPGYELLHASKEEGFTATAAVVTEPEVTMHRYTGFTATCRPNPVSEQDVEHFIQRRRAALAELHPHQGPAVKGNIAVLTYVGFVDGKMFEGGKAAKQQIQLGAGRMIPGFEEGILGHKAGDSFEIKVTFPADYGAAALAGKEAVFQAHLDDVCVRRMPALNSDFARRAGKADSMEAYRAAVRAQLEAMRKENAMGRARTEILRLLSEELEGSLPHRLTESAFMAQLNQMQEQLAMMRKTLDDYLRETGRSREEVLAELRAAAEKQVRVRIALFRIARLENLEPTEADIDAEISTQAARQGKTIAQYTAEVSRRAVRRGISSARAAEFVIAHSTILQA